MPGASGRRLMGFIYNVAPKDGTAIATAQRALPFDPLMGVDSHFDVGKVTWLGSANSETNVCMVWHTSPIATIDDVKHARDGGRHQRARAAPTRSIRT